MDETVICHVLKLSWTDLQEQPHDWVQREMRLKGFIAEHEAREMAKHGNQQSGGLVGPDGSPL